MQKVIGPEGGDVVLVHQGASVHVGSLEAGVGVSHRLGEGRRVYVYLIEGKLTLIGEELSSGDAAKVKELPQLTMHTDEATELILVDVPMTFEAVGIWQGRL